jgi:DNA gyrase subunit A
MATNIPPHNLREIVAALIALVEGRVDPTKEISDNLLYTIVPGPDFPTGATIMGKAGARQLYSTSNGGVIMRAVTNIEKMVRSKGQARTAIIVTELPYQVNKAALLEKIATLVNEKKLEGISDLRDESDRDGMRVVLELKRDAVAAVVLNNLYKKTSLQTSFSGNFLSIMMSPEGVLSPQRFTLRKALDYFLDFRFETIRRKSVYQLQKVEARAHIVEGLLIALAKVDAVIEIVRAAPDQSVARDALMDEDGILGLSKEQADSVLRLQLGQLTRLNQGKLEEEKKDLGSKEKALTRLLEVDEAVLDVMVEEFKEMDTKFGVERRTRILSDEGEVNEMALVKNSRSGKSFAAHNAHTKLDSTRSHTRVIIRSHCGDSRRLHQEDASKDI